MKLTRNIFLFLIALVLLMISPFAHAQGAGVTQILSGGTIVIPPTSTNTYYVYTLTNGVQNGTITTNTFGTPGTSSNLVVNVSEYDYSGLTFKYLGNAATTNLPVGISTFKSFDNGTTFETVSTWQFTNSPVAPGTTTPVVATNLDVHAATTLGFTFINYTSGWASNVVLAINRKVPRVGTQGAGLTTGVSPGTPITVPNGLN